VLGAEEVCNARGWMVRQVEAVVGIIIAMVLEQLAVTWPKVAAVLYYPAIFLMCYLLSLDPSFFQVFLHAWSDRLLEMAVSKSNGNVQSKYVFIVTKTHYLCLDSLRKWSECSAKQYREYHYMALRR